MNIQELVDQIFEEHVPYPPAENFQIEQFESQIGLKLPDDLKQFYIRCNGAKLFQHTQATPYTLLPIQQVKRTRIAIFGEDIDEFAPASWYAICDVMDGNYIGIDLDSQDSQTYSVIDCFHETHGTPGGNAIIAQSFTEFLNDALASGSRPYWLNEGFHSYGDALESKQVK